MYVYCIKEELTNNKSSLLIQVQHLEMINRVPRTFARIGRRSVHSKVKDHDVVVVSFARTPIGKMGGALSTMTAPQVTHHSLYNEFFLLFYV